eukprot:3315791-Lingulodinium_polyedra.AAC.1
MPCSSRIGSIPEPRAGSIARSPRARAAGAELPRRPPRAAQPLAAGPRVVALPELRDEEAVR